MSSLFDLPFEDDDAVVGGIERADADIPRDLPRDIEDQTTFLAALDDPPLPNDALKRLAAEDRLAPTEQALVPLVEVLPADFQLPLLLKFVPDVRLRDAAKVAAEKCAAVVVSGQSGLQAVDAELDNVRGAIKAIEASFKRPAEIANELHKHVTSTRAEWLERPLEVVDLKNKEVYAEQKRIKALEDEQRRQVQAEADRLAREAAARAAADAERQQADARVVEALKAQAKTAVAPPVSVPRSAPLASTTTVETWKARFIGTPDDAEEQNPDIKDLSDAQRLSLIQTLKAIIDGKLPIAAIKEMNWTYLNKRADSERSAWNIPGLETFDAGTARAKAKRGKR